MTEIVALVDEPPPSQNPTASLIHLLAFHADDALELLQLVIEKEIYVPSVIADFGEWLSAKRYESFVQFNTLLLRIDSIP